MRLQSATDGDPGRACLWLPSGQRVSLNDSAATLLARCDGTKTAQQLAEACPDRDAAKDFLAAAVKLGWVTTVERDSPDPARGAARR